VQIVPWARQSQATPGDVVIEMFGCHLSDAYIAQIGKASPPPVWLNLEHLSAEKWVDLHHLKPSPQSGGLMKYFYYPGFRKIRRPASRIQPDLAARQLADAALGQTHRPARPRPAAPARPCAHRAAVQLCPPAARWLACTPMAASERPVALWVCPGPVMTAINTWLDMTLQTGQITSRGSLSIYALPYIPQQRFDELLWAADVCIVRGEDSFVRAQWAAKPFVWHIYPQEDSAHDRKLDAFLDLYLE
jgi:Uncharacterized protein conserved in bacteria